MILIMGPSGSGKTTVAKELDKLGCYIVPTYTTRGPRPDDAYTICVYDDTFRRLLNNKRFISHATFHAKFGDVSYGIPVEEYLQNVKSYATFPVVIISAYEYVDDIVEYAKMCKGDPVFKVYLDVDIDTIVKKSLGDSKRGQANIDLYSRVERDSLKNEKLKHYADFVVNNRGMQKSPYDIACDIVLEYQNFLTKKMQGGI